MGPTLSSSPISHADASYEKRAIAFLDILGFSDLIKEGGHEREIGQIFDQLKVRAAQAEMHHGKGRMQFTAFSDCIVVSEEFLGGFGALRIAGYAGYLALELLGYGFLVRGGLTVGDLYHREGVVFGPAMNEAYTLESKIAVYPRLVVTEPFRAAAFQCVLAEVDGQADHMRVQWTMSQYRSDFDGVTHYDIFHPLSPTPDRFISMGGGKGNSNEIRGRASIAAVRNVRQLRFKDAVAQKYDWMDNYLEVCVKQYGWQRLLEEADTPSAR